jgi:hypothetical protein
MKIKRKRPKRAPEFKIIRHGRRHLEIFGPAGLLRNLVFLARRWRDEDIKKAML